MDLEIKNKKENPVLQRQEVTGEIKFTGAATPSNKQLQEELAKKLGAQQELVVIKHIYGSFGSGKATFEAYAYASKEQFDKIEPKKKEKAAAPGAAPAAK
jgi:small subunit ribosomal protein S24e